MTIKELTDRLGEYPDDREVVVLNDNGLLEVAERVEEGQFGSPGGTGPDGYLRVVVVVS